MAMSMELQNANPTIINASELPTRRGEKRRKTTYRTGQDITTFDSDLHWDTPLEGHGLFGISSDGDEYDDDNAGDPIDEQEIFGMHYLRFVLLASRFARLSFPRHGVACCADCRPIVSVMMVTYISLFGMAWHALHRSSPTYLPALMRVCSLPLDFTFWRVEAVGLALRSGARPQLLSCVLMHFFSRGIKR